MTDLKQYGFGNMREDYPRYFQALDGLLGMNALSIIASAFGFLVLAKPEKKNIYTFITF